MFLVRLISFGDFVYCVYFLHLCISYTANAEFSDGSPPNGYGPKPAYDKTYQCNRRIKITPVTQVTTIAEEPAWSAANNMVIWAGPSIYAKNNYQLEPPGGVNAYDPETGRNYNIYIGPEFISSISPVKSRKDLFLVAYGAKFILLKWKIKEGFFEYRDAFEPDPSRQWPDWFMHDTKILPNGWIPVAIIPIIPLGGVDAAPRNQSTLYIFKKGVRKTIYGPTDFSNGLGWSPDFKTLYHSDSVLRTTFKSDYDFRTNTLTNTRILVNFTEAQIAGQPDSMCVDKAGYVWIACFVGGRIIKVDPNGTNKVLCTIVFPSRQVTNICFGKCPGEKGKRLRCMYVTTARKRLVQPSIFEGALLRVDGTGAEGDYPYEVDLKDLYPDGVGPFPPEDDYPSKEPHKGPPGEPPKYPSKGSSASAVASNYHSQSQYS